MDKRGEPAQLGDGSAIETVRTTESLMAKAGVSLANRAFAPRRKKMS